MSRHINIPIFIPHLGCPEACVFCNQKKISGKEKFSLDKVRQEINTVLTTVRADDDVEIAFFGGSFTAISRSLMIELLAIGKSYIDRGIVKTLRCSTRPDAIDEEVLTILSAYGMKTIELGVQSMSDEVLLSSRRGHTSEQTIKACKLIKKHGFSLVLQMMLGLPGASLENEIETARFIVKIKADGARIYPTVVFFDTELCSMAKEGVYTPLTDEEAIRRGSAVLRVLMEGSVPVIRIGLCASENLSSKETVYAGANHPALGELIIGEVYYQTIFEQITELPDKDEITVCVNVGELSFAIGHKKKNKMRLMNAFPQKSIHFCEQPLADEEMVIVR